VRALAELDVLVLDCQATGASPAFGHVLFLGWTVVGGRGAGEGEPSVEAHWIALPEGHVVPGQVRKLTGWQPSAAVGALPDREAWRRLLAAAGSARPAPTAIHYARFELAFLREWAARLAPEAPFPFDPVCVYAIANRLYPDLPRLSLRALAGYLGHGLALERRAPGHVEATAFVWRRMRDELAARGIATWEALQAWLSDSAPPRRPRSAKPRYPIDSQRFRSLPDQPGVYRFLRRNGDVLYVGKAASLKKRTASHFIGRASKLIVPEMLTQVSDIAVEVAPSALEAALLENETIKALNPPYNVQLRSGDPRVWYSDATFASAAAAPDELHRIGPLSSEHALRPLGALVELLSGGAASLSVRAHAVGVSALWPPGEAVFAAGWQGLLARHREAMVALMAGGGEPRWQGLQLARILLAAADAADRDVDEATDPGAEREWDPERVTRHLERAAAQAYRAYRRSRWLRLLHDCDVTYREPGSAAPRTLQIRGGRIAGPTDPAGEGPLALRFDRARYDRLRILTTELKRVLRDGGDACVTTRAGRALGAERLRAIAALV
jgi:DNA polymerase III epsilon subunit-like protein